MLKRERNLMMAGVVTVAMILAGCGNRAPANAPIDDSASSTPSASTAPAASDAAPVATPAPVAPATQAYVAPPVVGSLVVTNVEKNKSGIILFKTLTVTGSVLNSSNVALSGTLKVQFKKSGLFSSTEKDTSDKTVAVPLLQPGQSFPFSVAADEHNDTDADVTVTSNPPAQTAAPATTAAAAMMQNPYAAAQPY